MELHNKEIIKKKNVQFILNGTNFKIRLEKYIIVQSIVKTSSTKSNSIML